MRTGAIIYPILANAGDLTTLVPASSIFALRAEQPTSTSYIVYREISSTPLNTKGDSINTSLNPRALQRSILDTNTVQISCFANTYLEVENIAVEVRNALDREWGSVPSPYSNDIYVDSIVYDSAVDDYDNDYGDRGVYIKHLDFTIRVSRLNSGYSNQYSIQYDGVDAYLLGADANALTPNNSGANRGFSISLWMKGNPDGGSFTGGLVEKVDFALGLEYQIYTDSNGYPIIILVGGNTFAIYQKLTAPFSLYNGNWNHLVFTFDLSDASSSIVCYINGILYSAAEGNASYSATGIWTPIVNTTSPFTAGVYFGSTYNVYEIDEIAIYDDNLSQDNVNSLFNNGLTSNATDVDYLLGWWRMGDINGPSVYPTIVDDSTNNNPLVMTNMLDSDITTDVPIGVFPNLYSLFFDGIDAYTSIPNNTALTPHLTGGFTIMFWIKLDQVGAVSHILNKNATSNSEYTVQIQASGKPIFYFYGNLDATIYQAAEFNTALVADTWYHIACSFDNGSGGLSLIGFINGEDIISTKTSGGVWSPTVNGTAPLWMGRASTNYSKIELDEVAVFEDAQPPRIIKAIYSARQVLDLTPYDDLKGWWRMGDTSGPSVYPTIVDASSNTNDATMNNMLNTDITTDVP